MPPPLQVVTWTATQSFQVGGRRACLWCGPSYSICVPSLKFVGFPVSKIWLIFGHGIKQPGNLDLDLLSSKWGVRSPVSWASFLKKISASYAFPFSIYGQALDRQTVAISTLCLRPMGVRAQQGRTDSFFSEYNISVAVEVWSWNKLMEVYALPFLVLLTEMHLVWIKNLAPEIPIRSLRELCGSGLTQRENGPVKQKPAVEMYALSCVLHSADRWSIVWNSVLVIECFELMWAGFRSGGGVGIESRRVQECSQCPHRSWQTAAVHSH